MKIILACWLALLPGLLSAPLFAQGLPDGPHITVSGQGRVKVVPNVFEIHLSVEKQDKNIDAAKQYVDAHTARAISVARGLGIARHDITSTQIFITPRYDYDDKTRHLVGYMVRRQVTLILRDTDKYDQLLDKLVAAGVNGINGVSASYSNPAALSSQAFAQAVDAARARAKQLAQAFGAGLGAIYSITEVSSPAPRPRPLAMEKASFAVAGASQPGMIEVEASIRATFTLKP